MAAEAGGEVRVVMVGRSAGILMEVNSEAAVDATVDCGWVVGPIEMHGEAKRCSSAAV